MTPEPSQHEIAPQSPAAPSGRPVKGANGTSWLATAGAVLGGVALLAVVTVAVHRAVVGEVLHGLLAALAVLLGAAAFFAHRRAQRSIDGAPLDGASADSQRSSRVAPVEVLGVVASGFAHDINNLMAVVQVNRDLLEAKLATQELTDRDEISLILERVQRAIHRGKALIQRMLGVVHLDHLDEEDLTPEELILTTIDLIRPTLPAHIRIVTDELAVTQIRGDRTQLEQVLFNLLTNAIHAIANEPGEIRLSARDAPEGYVTLTVIDSGCGMAGDALEHIFEPFYTTKPPGSGTGLGLAQVQRVVTRHGGRVDLHSRVGQGTTVDVMLPLDHPFQRTTDADLAEELLPVSGHPSPRALLVEDEDDIAAVIVAALPATEIRRVGSADLALRVIGGTSTHFDLLLLDLSLPGGSGAAVFRAAREKWPEVPTLVLTGDVGPDVDVLLSEPSTQCLRKPFSLRELRAAVARMVGFAAPGEGNPPNSHTVRR